MLEQNKKTEEIFNTLKCSQTISEKYFENISPGKLNKNIEDKKEERTEINSEKNNIQIKKDNDINIKIKKEFDNQNQSEAIDTLRKVNCVIKLSNQLMSVDDLENLKNRIDNLKKIKMKQKNIVKNMNNLKKINKFNNKLIYY